MIIILFHLVGLYGFLTPSFEPLFIKLVPYHLLLMLGLMVLTVNDRSVDLFKFAIGVYMAGFFIEVIGVNTGQIFGDYTYGSALGIKLWATPLLIGVNWLVLVYCTGVFLQTFNLNSKWLFSALGAGILLGIDFLIEPVAIRFDYWSWFEGIIPIQNYLGWYIFSYGLFLFFSGLNFNKKNKAAVVLLFAQLGFFLALNLWAI
jgi:bisanhydrobacterioruberin hydratase